jgi:peptide-methionine (S)-S-oxide reductase
VNTFSPTYCINEVGICCRKNNEVVGVPCCRQGNDVGPQYRSIVLYTSDDQKAVAEEMMAEVNKDKWYSDPLVTELVPLERFWPGEGYHQNYYNDNPNQGYCKVVVGPKVAKFRSKFFQKLMK